MISRTIKISGRTVLGALLLSLLPALHTQASMNLDDNKSIPSSRVSATDKTDSLDTDPYNKKFGAALGIQFPTGPFLELNYRPFQNFSFGISGGGISIGGLLIDQESKQYGVPKTVRTLAFETKPRWHVMNGAFFIGLAAGWQSLTVSGINADRLNSGTIDRFYFTPNLGWMWVMNSGFTLGTEFGVQVPFTTPNITLTGPSIQSHQKVVDASSHILPYLTLIKLGYFF